jgi:hypothetical protein
VDGNKGRSQPNIQWRGSDCCHIGHGAGIIALIDPHWFCVSAAVIFDLNIRKRLDKTRRSSIGL